MGCLTDFPCEPLDAGMTTRRDGLEPFPKDEGLAMAVEVTDDWLLAELSSPPLLPVELLPPDRGEEESLLPSFM